MSALVFDVICEETLLGLQIYHVHLIGQLCSGQSGHYYLYSHDSQCFLLLRVGWGMGKT